MKTSKKIQNLPLVVFLTGASGAGKTTLVNILNRETVDSSTAFLHFDSIGVPSAEEMIKTYGSPSEWQKAMTHQWIKIIINEYQDKKLIIFEGQVNIEFIISAFKEFDFQKYKIILVHCNQATRHKRLHEDRSQPELINDEMDNWAKFLKKQAIDRNVVILDTSLMKENEMSDWIKKYISKLTLE